MKSLSILKNNYELASAPLSKSVITVGRSPHNDLVLRAPGVTAEHFVIRWNGAGEFDPEQDKWCLEDLSSGASSHTYHLSKIENFCAGFAFKKEDSAYRNESFIGGSLLKEFHSTKSRAFISLTRDLEAVWMSAQGKVREVKHIKLETLSGQLFSPFEGVPELKIVGTQAPGSATVQLKVLSSALKDAVVFLNGKDLSFEDVLLKDNSTLSLSWGKELIFLRLVSRIVPPEEKARRLEPALVYFSVLATLLLSTLMFFSGTSKLPFELVEKEAELIKIEIPAEELSEFVAAPVPLQSEKIVPLETPKELPVAKKPEAKAQSSKVAVKADSRPSSGKQGGGRDMAASKILSLLSRNKMAKGNGLSSREIMNTEVPSQTISGHNQKAPVLIHRMPGGILGKGKGGAPDGTGQDSGLLAAASTSQLNREPGTTSLGKVGTLGNGKGANFARIGNGSGKGSGNALFNSQEIAIVGGLDRETVRRVIAGQKGKVQVCYDKALVMNPDIGGRIVFKWKIQPTGNVSTTAITKSQVASRILEGCVESVIKDMLFPKTLNGAITTVIYPFEFFAKN